MVDVDIPMGIEVFGHALRTGGYYRWTGLYGGLRMACTSRTSTSSMGAWCWMF